MLETIYRHNAWPIMAASLLKLSRNDWSEMRFSHIFLSSAQVINNGGTCAGAFSRQFAILNPSIILFGPE